MTKIILFLIFVALFIFIATTPIWQSALWGIGELFTSFYDNVLVYWNVEIWVIFAFFIFILLYAIIKH